ncbi:MAG: hypothetical protein HY320_12535 [Armatimonadetes bacterium]|nr:hypothetical protein [Armatimonadota bacterium]
MDTQERSEATTPGRGDSKTRRRSDGATAPRVPAAGASAGSRTPERRLTSTLLGFWFGPGLLLALLAIVIVAPHLPSGGRGDVSFPTYQQSGDHNRPPSATALQGVTAIDAVPEPDWLLGQRHALRLTASQVSRLRRLQTRWQRETRALREALDQASADFDRAMSENKGQVTTIMQLRERAAPVTQLSRQLSDARRAWWDEASRALSAAQRQSAERLWTARWTKRTDDKESR